MPKADWDRLVAQVGPQRARQALQESGYPMQDDDEPDPDTDPELPAADSNPAGGFGVKPVVPLAVQPGATANSLAVGLPAAGAKPDLAALYQQGQKSISDLYTDALARLEAHYKGPDTSDLLISMGAAMMQPTPSGRFTDALANAASVIPEWAKGKRETANDLLKTRAEFELKQAEALGTYNARYLAAVTKDPNAGKRIDPTTGLVIDLNNLGPTGGTVKLPSGHILFPWQDGTYHSPKDPSTGISDVYQKVGGDYHMVSHSQGDP